MQTNKSFKRILIVLTVCLFASCGQKATEEVPTTATDVAVDSAPGVIDESPSLDEVTAIPDYEMETYQEPVDLPESEPEEIAKSTVRLHNISNRQVTLRYGDSQSLRLPAKDTKTIDTYGERELIVATPGPSAVSFRLLPGVTYGVFYIKNTRGWTIQKITVRS